MTVLHTTKEINVNEIRIDLGSFPWHTPKPLNTSTRQQKDKVQYLMNGCLCKSASWPEALHDHGSDS